MSTEHQERFIAEALRAVLTPQGWAVAWQAGALDLEEEAVAWLRSRPAPIRDLLLRFPPSCLVQTRAGVSLGIPAPGTVGIVSSYFEQGLLGVRQHPEATTVAQCVPEDLEVVGYYRGLTPERLRGVLEQGTMDEQRPGPV